MALRIITSNQKLSSMEGTKNQWTRWQKKFCQMKIFHPQRLLPRFFYLYPLLHLLLPLTLLLLCLVDIVSRDLKRLEEIGHQRVEDRRYYGLNQCQQQIEYNMCLDLLQTFGPLPRQFQAYYLLHTYQR